MQSPSRRSNASQGSAQARGRIIWDCSYIDREPWRATGIQRVVRELGEALVVEGRRRGRDVVVGSLGGEAVGPTVWELARIPRPQDKPLGVPRRPLELSRDDLVFVADSSWHLGLSYRLAPWWLEGMRLAVLQHDVVPLTHSWTADEGLVRQFGLWMLEVGTFADGVVAVSRSTAEATRAMLARTVPWRELAAERVRVCWLSGMHARQPSAQRIVDVQSGPVVAVGTLEPRKNYTTVLDGFEAHWQAGGSVPLVIVGRLGWRANHIGARIEELVQAGRPLTWLADASDEKLWRTIMGSRALLSLSVEEGFDLPSVEAAVNGVPLILSDIPVHRELFDGYARFVGPGDASALAALLGEIQEVGITNPPTHPLIVDRTWHDGARELLEILDALPMDAAIRARWRERTAPGADGHPGPARHVTPPLVTQLVARARVLVRGGLTGSLARAVAAQVRAPATRRAVFEVAQRVDRLERLLGDLESAVRESTKAQGRLLEDTYGRLEALASLEALSEQLVREVADVKHRLGAVEAPERRTLAPELRERG
ncbi:glycosyl transferase group 1 [Acidimicrobium ferrooxidans DSM 10331]|uniref:Glycosyl transferase group 1 n=1 Tax=Acidimicrobium ferrooxidans (strain DSM 10331 / JCM 15462 / NBRC 103882 / ICP) TaxID=525909 RepID=C7M1Y2_ACIFD|nr:glycosyltransferase [Acidimicrobium ferrooxidans]ACU54879.1 glycosyl transferase group 1 [Acidimicrobium ferrooxidans DSM 10331]